MAVDKECLPETFRFDVYLKIAAKYLDNIFNIENAKERYGFENEHYKAPSLRRQARHIYGFSYIKKEVGFLINLGYDDPYNQDYDDEINNSVDENNFKFSKNALFDRIGGKALWLEFEKNLVVSYWDMDPYKAKDDGENDLMRTLIELNDR